jgi:hypothetical protein
MRKPRRRFFLVTGLLLLLLSGIGLALVLRGTATARNGLITARARWETRQFAEYRLQIQQQTGTRLCDQEVIARSERDTEAIRNSCGQPPTWTVTRLFNWISELERSPVRCYPGPARCICQATARVRVTYDPELGYPREINYEWRRRPNYIQPAYWQSLRDQSFPGCENIEAGGELSVRVGLEPEP